MDFTLSTYQSLLKSLLKQKYNFQTFKDSLESPKSKSIILRHDVDKLPTNSLRFAKIQKELGIKGSYYFRAVPCSWNEEIIKEIALMGHEIGYHYESLTTCNGNMEKAIEDFDSNLKKIRELAPVSTICMHGSPQSKYDSRNLWQKHNYKDFCIIGEPYFNIDFNKVFYLTDTGRMWDGYKVSLRDKINEHQERWNNEGLTFHNTQDIIKAINENRLPDKTMFTFHPQRWTDKLFLWIKEYLLQSVKNLVKRVIVFNN